MLIFFVKYILQNERLSNTSKVPNDFIGIFDVVETFLAIPQINEVWIYYMDKHIYLINTFALGAELDLDLDLGAELILKTKTQ